MASRDSPIIHSDTHNNESCDSDTKRDAGEDDSVRRTSAQNSAQMSLAVIRVTGHSLVTEQRSQAVIIRPITRSLQMIDTILDQSYSLHRIQSKATTHPIIKLSTFKHILCRYTTHVFISLYLSTFKHILCRYTLPIIYLTRFPLGVQTKCV